jgi:hypothetical protein
MTDMVKARLQAAEAEGNVAREANTRNSHRIDALMAVHGSGGRSSATFSRDLHQYRASMRKSGLPRLLHDSHVARVPAERAMCMLEADVMGAGPRSEEPSHGPAVSRAGAPRARGALGAKRGAGFGRARGASTDLRKQRHQEHGPC